MGTKMGIGFVLAAALLPACATEPPDIDVATELDLGSVAKGEKARAQIPIRNLGGSTLTVLGISTSCGCTKAVLSSPEIGPGNEAVLHIEYDSGAHAEDMGEIERYVFISSNDPDEDDVQLRFLVRVRQTGS